MEIVKHVVVSAKYFDKRCTVREAHLDKKAMGLRVTATVFDEFGSVVEVRLITGDGRKNNFLCYATRRCAKSQVDEVIAEMAASAGVLIHVALETGRVEV